MRIGQIDTPGQAHVVKKVTLHLLLEHLFQNLQLGPLRVDDRVDTVICVLPDPYQTSFFPGLGTPRGSTLCCHAFRQGSACDQTFEPTILEAGEH